MDRELFERILGQVQGRSSFIYFHIMGEPLLHPQLDQLLTIAERAGLNINITTNAGLLDRKKEILLRHSVRQINVSLHDAEENITPEKWGDYMMSALEFAIKTAPKTYVCLRLWNTTNESSTAFNEFCLDKIAFKFNIQTELLNEKKNGNGLRLSEHIFLQRAPRFEWPDDKKVGTQTRKNCYALRDHIAILVDGQVVPCCLDADASMKMGNIFSEDLADILQTDRAKQIKKGFEQRKIVEPICATCGFIID
jgi:radical SAM protein with 4Fe4S-binding SPASM domain